MQKYNNRLYLTISSPYRFRYSHFRKQTTPPLAKANSGAANQLTEIKESALYTF